MQNCSDECCYSCGCTNSSHVLYYGRSDPSINFESSNSSICNCCNCCPSSEVPTITLLEVGCHCANDWDDPNIPERDLSYEEDEKNKKCVRINSKRIVCCISRDALTGTNTSVSNLSQPSVETEDSIVPLQETKPQVDLNITSNQNAQLEESGSVAKAEDSMIIHRRSIYGPSGVPRKSRVTIDFIPNIMQDKFRKRSTSESESASDDEMEVSSTDAGNLNILDKLLDDDNIQQSHKFVLETIPEASSTPSRSTVIHSDEKRSDNKLIGKKSSNFSVEITAKVAGNNINVVSGEKCIAIINNNKGGKEEFNKLCFLKPNPEKIKSTETGTQSSLSVLGSLTKSTEEAQKLVPPPHHRVIINDDKQITTNNNIQNEQSADLLHRIEESMYIQISEANIPKDLESTVQATKLMTHLAMEEGLLVLKPSTKNTTVSKTFSKSVGVSFSDFRMFSTNNPVSNGMSGNTLLESVRSYPDDTILRNIRETEKSSGDGSNNEFEIDTVPIRDQVEAPTLTMCKCKKNDNVEKVDKTNNPIENYLPDCGDGCKRCCSGCICSHKKALNDTNATLQNNKSPTPSNKRTFLDKCNFKEICKRGKICKPKDNPKFPEYKIKKRSISNTVIKDSPTVSSKSQINAQEKVITVSAKPSQNSTNIKEKLNTEFPNKPAYTVINAKEKYGKNDNTRENQNNKNTNMFCNKDTCPKKTIQTLQITNICLLDNTSNKKEEKILDKSSMKINTKGHSNIHKNKSNFNKPNTNTNQEKSLTSKKQAPKLHMKDKFFQNINALINKTKSNETTHAGFSNNLRPNNIISKLFSSLIYNIEPSSISQSKSSAIDIVKKDKLNENISNSKSKNKILNDKLKFPSKCEEAAGDSKNARKKPIQKIKNSKSERIEKTCKKTKLDDLRKSIELTLTDEKVKDELLCYLDKITTSTNKCLDHNELNEIKSKVLTKLLSVMAKNNLKNNAGNEKLIRNQQNRKNNVDNNFENELEEILKELCSSQELDETRLQIENEKKYKQPKKNQLSTHCCRKHLKPEDGKETLNVPIYTFESQEKIKGSSKSQKTVQNLFTHQQKKHKNQGSSCCIETKNHNIFKRGGPNVNVSKAHVISTKLSKKTVGRKKNSWNDILKQILKKYNKDHKCKNPKSKRSKNALIKSDKKDQNDNPDGFIKVVYLNPKTHAQKESFFLRSSNYTVSYLFVEDIANILTTNILRPLSFCSGSIEIKTFDESPSESKEICCYNTINQDIYLNFSIYNKNELILARDNDGLVNRKNLLQIVELFQDYKFQEQCNEKRRRIELKQSLEDIKPFFSKRKTGFYYLTSFHYEMNRRCVARHNKLNEIGVYSISSVTILMISIYFLVLYYFCSN